MKSKIDRFRRKNSHFKVGPPVFEIFALSCNAAPTVDHSHREHRLRSLNFHQQCLLAHFIFLRPRRFKSRWSVCSLSPPASNSKSELTPLKSQSFLSESKLCGTSSFCQQTGLQTALAASFVSSSSDPIGGGVLSFSNGDDYIPIPDCICDDRCGSCECLRCGQQMVRSGRLDSLFTPGRL